MMGHAKGWGNEKNPTPFIGLQGGGLDRTGMLRYVIIRIVYEIMSLFGG